MDEKFAKRFWSGVDKSGGDTACWPWLRGRQRDGGYGRFPVGAHGMLLTHRVAWALTYGELPAFTGQKTGVCVLHRCDNPSCCNPAHLFLGSQLDNVRDMDRKGRARRAPCGEAHYQALLTAQDVADMRFARAYSGAPYEAIAKAYGVARKTAMDAIKGVTWRAPKPPVNPATGERMQIPVPSAPNMGA